MFQVVWTRVALDELARIWIQVDSNVRRAITIAADAVDRELQTSPQSQGESREDQQRIFFVYPLGIRYLIDVQHSVVRVLRVWNIRRRK
jgi:hypothetical protein